MLNTPKLDPEIPKAVHSFVYGRKLMYVYTQTENVPFKKYPESFESNPTSTHQVSSFMAKLKDGT